MASTASPASPIPCPAAARDRLAVAVLCLAPRQRACLDWVARAGRPVRSIEVARGLGADRGYVHGQLCDLWSDRLVARSGSGDSARYCPADGVAELLPIVASVAMQGSHLKPENGLDVLRAARDLIENGEWPSRSQVEDATGMRSGGICAWVARLAAAGLLPGIERLSPRDRQGSMRRAPKVAREKGEAAKGNGVVAGRRRLAWDARGGGRVYRVDRSVAALVGGDSR